MTPGESGRDGRRVVYAWRSGWGVRSPGDARLVQDRDGAAPAALIDRLPGPPACAFLVTGLGCADGSCAPWTAGLERVESHAPGAPHSHPEHDAGTGPIEVWRLR